jgi:hypothetical protein
MADAPRAARDPWNGARWPTGSGHYESWFVRANHPTRPLGFWLRHTIYAPAAAPDEAQGELWAIWFDGEHGRIVAARSEHPAAGCRFDRGALGVSIAGAALDDRGLSGTCESAGHRVTWSLACEGGTAPLLLLEQRAYERSFPKAKALVPRPSCRLTGRLEVDGERIDIHRWPGSQNHNWGPAHTDRYAWGQVAGFDGHEDAFLECSSAPAAGPGAQPVAHGGGAAPGRPGAPLQRHRPVGAGPGAARRFEVDGTDVEPCRAAAGRDRRRSVAFVALRYRDPPGGAKRCLNTKIASCDVELRQPGKAPLVLRSEHRCAFELLGLGDRRVPATV